ncbi:MAG: GNAT family N-acetyltransferase [Hyphomicrobiaceae bacterium]
MLALEPASFPEDRDSVVDLFREYQRSLGVDLCFQGFDAEVAGLPGSYAPPNGRLILARSAGRPVGCIALRRHDGESGEIKRLYVRPSARGLSLGSRLVAAIVEEARAIGYRRLCLDTLPEMIAAQALYERLGFRPIAAYTFNPVAGARYLGLTL